MIKIICINASNKPAEYPASDIWLVKEQEYSVLQVSRLIGGVIGVRVAEIEPSIDNPFKYFNLERFVIPADQLAEFIAFVEESFKDQEEDNIELNLEAFLQVEELVL